MRGGWRNSARAPVDRGARSPWHGLRNWDRKKTAEASKTAQESQLELFSPIFVGSANSREQAGNPAKTLGLVVGCSRLFPAVPGTRDRKGTAAEALAVPLAARSEPWTLNQPTSYDRLAERRIDSWRAANMMVMRDTLPLRGGIAAGEVPAPNICCAMWTSPCTAPSGMSRIATRCSRAGCRTRSRPCSAPISVDIGSLCCRRQEILPTKRHAFSPN